jgi:hypothetical protein
MYDDDLYSTDLWQHLEDNNEHEINEHIPLNKTAMVDMKTSDGFSLFISNEFEHEYDIVSWLVIRTSQQKDTSMGKHI